MTVICHFRGDVKKLPGSVEIARAKISTIANAAHTQLNTIKQKEKKENPTESHAVIVEIMYQRIHTFPVLLLYYSLHELLLTYFFLGHSSAAVLHIEHTSILLFIVSFIRQIFFFYFWRC